MKAAVLGDGGWGTTLAIILKKKALSVSLWGAFKDNIEALRIDKENKKFLQGVKIPDGIEFTDQAELACKDADFIILAVPSRFFREVLNKHKSALTKSKASFISVVKGLEETSLKRMSEVFYEVLGELKLAILSGPSIAQEVAQGMPAAVSVASPDEALASRVRDLFMTHSFRVYTNSDVIGVELGGALKNVIAIAAGISDGLGFGTNAKAAIVTRGLYEIARLGVSMGAREESFNGLSGLGDLVTTCISLNSRNRSFGQKIGEGALPIDVLNNSVMEIEGVWTAKAMVELGRNFKLDLPITQQVYSVVFENKSPLSAVNELMTREPKEE